MAKKQKPVNYVDNAEFLRLLTVYSEERKRREQNDLPKNRVPEEIGRIFIDMATKLANRFNFTGYTFKEDMIGDGILNAIEAINNFDPTKSANPFAYFTQVIYWCYVRRIQKENKDHKTKMEFAFSIDAFVQDENSDHSITSDSALQWYYS